MNETVKAIAKALEKRESPKDPPLSIPLAGGLFGVRPLPDKRGVSFEYLRRF